MRKNRAYRPRHAMERPDPVYRRPSSPPPRSSKRVLAVSGVVAAGLAAALLPGTSFAAGGVGQAGLAIAAPVIDLVTPIPLLGVRSLPVTARMVENTHAPESEPSTPRPRLVTPISTGRLAMATREVTAGLGSRAMPMAPQDTAIPMSAFSAYRVAATTLGSTDSSCHLQWWILAGVGRIESGHAAQGRVDASGTTLGPILSAAPNLSEPGSVVPDTDGGRYDHSATSDRAVGAMQIMPSVWEAYGRDGNGDGIADPDNIYDSATTTGSLLCQVGGNLAKPANLAMALLNLDPSTAYLQSVVSWGVAYRDSATETDNATGLVPTTPQEQPLTVIPLVSDANGTRTMPVADGDTVVSSQPGSEPSGGPSEPVLPAAPTPTDTPTTQTPAEPAPSPTSPAPQPTSPQPEPTQPAATSEPPPPTQDPTPPATSEPAPPPASTPSEQTTQSAPDSAPAAAGGSGRGSAQAADSAAASAATPAQGSTPTQSATVDSVP